MYYNNSTLSGFSGAPVLGWCEEEGSIAYKVIGIHNGGVDKFNDPTLNYGHRISHFLEALENNKDRPLLFSTSSRLANTKVFNIVCFSAAILGIVWITKRLRT